jgi:L-seryl-tRNA(Ser) seleniumtransferase
MSSKPVVHPRPPSVDHLLTSVRLREGFEREHEIVADAARSVIADERARMSDGHDARLVRDLVDDVIAKLDAYIPPEVDEVINATGVIIHTNLGRAPWPGIARVVVGGTQGYLMLEMDRDTGRRGPRDRRAEEHLIALTGAEDALVTNNNAAALALAVGLLGRGGAIAVSRGELVEIGGGVRIPDIIRRAGAKLVEVGTTNRTRAADFEAPLAEGRAHAILRVHPSNFTIAGFTEAPEAAEVADLAHRHGAIVIDDLGSGALLPTERFGLPHEPMPNERLAAGSDVVTFSGDKLVGGPQAGLIVGRADLVTRMRRDPLARAMRPDKATLLGVAATLGLYRAGLATTHIPVWQMIAVSVDYLRARAAEMALRLGESVRVVDLSSTVGGGSLPGETLPSAGLELTGGSASKKLAALRHGSPAVIGRIENDRVVLDYRTVSPETDGELALALERVLAG